MPAKKYYALCQSDLYLERRHPLFTTYEKVELPKYETLSPQWHGKKIPLSMWQEILAFMKYSYDELKSETMCFLYYDEKKKQPWSFWVPPQITNGMTVKSDPEHVNFQVQRAQYPDLLFGTVHHHCSSSAFQSGTDEADETNREGFHFTIGNLNKEDIDIHFRWCLDNECHELEELSMVIDGAKSPFKDDVVLTNDMYDIELEYMNKQFYVIPDLKKYDFTKYMDNVSKPKVPAHRTKRASSFYQSNWDSWDVNPSKKNSVHDEVLLDHSDIAEEIVFNLKFDNNAEEYISEYYTQYETKDSAYLINQLVQARTSDEEYARVLHKMLTHSVYLTTKDGKDFYKLYQEQLDIYKGQGYIITDNDILQELETIANDEIGKTI